MKLPDINQNPREYHENLKSVVKFIEESVNRIESLNKNIEECGMIDIGGKKYLDEQEVKNLIKGFVESGEVEKLEARVIKSISESVKDELKPYELTKDVNGKIKSCRDTMGENYDNHAKGVDNKVFALTKDVEEFKESQISAHEKLVNITLDSEKSTTKKISEYSSSIDRKVADIGSEVSEAKKLQALDNEKAIKLSDKKIKEIGEKIEKSILKKVLDKISKLMG